MSRNVINVPKGASIPDWDRLPDEGELVVFKIQVLPQQVANIIPNSLVLQAGKSFSFFIQKAERLPEKPTQPPLQPYKVWCKKLF